MHVVSQARKSRGGDRALNRLRKKRPSRAYCRAYGATKQEEPRSSFRIPTSNRFSVLGEEEQEGDDRGEHQEHQEHREAEEDEGQAEQPGCRLCGGEGHTADQCPDLTDYARAAEAAQQPGASEEATLRRLQPQFPAPRGGTGAAYDNMAVLDDLPWGEVIAPNPFATIKNVPPHVQGQVLDTMR